MSQPFQGITVPLGALSQAPSLFLITTGGHSVSRERFLDDLNLPKELEDVVHVQSMMEGPRDPAFIVTCPDQWIFNQVYQNMSLMGQGYSVNLVPVLPNSMQGSTGGSTVGLPMPALGPLSGLQTVGVPFSGLGPPSPWVAINPPQSPALEPNESPFINHGYNEVIESWSSLSAGPGHATANHGSVSQMPTGHLHEVESSDDDEEFFGVAEGEEEDVEEWDGKDGDMRCDNEGEDGETHLIAGDAPSDEESYESSSTSNRTEKGEEGMSSKEEETETEDLDHDAHEDNETDADSEEPLANGYDADRSGADSDQESYQIKRKRPHRRSFISQRTRGRRYTQASVPLSSPTGTSTPTADSGHLPSRSSSSAADDRSKVVPDPEKNIISNNSAGEEDADMDDLVHAMSAMAPTFSDDDGIMTPDVVPNAQIVQDSPDTSTESAILLGTIREGFSATLHVNPSTILGPDVLASVNDDED
ncbi:hypothetical protein FRC01_007758 [Tulasnella sp. 417]|nr:hypothetical protein FRC01_007758 [Tulasnella sp. 417]